MSNPLVYSCSVNAKLWFVFLQFKIYRNGEGHFHLLATVPCGPPLRRCAHNPHGFVVKHGVNPAGHPYVPHLSGFVNYKIYEYTALNAVFHCV